MDKKEILEKAEALRTKYSEYSGLLSERARVEQLMRDISLEFDVRKKELKRILTEEFSIACPFCDSQLLIQFYDERSTGAFNICNWYATCHSCGARTPSKKTLLALLELLDVLSLVGITSEDKEQ